MRSGVVGVDADVGIEASLHPTEVLKKGEDGNPSPAEYSIELLERMIHDERWAKDDLST